MTSSHKKSESYSSYILSEGSAAIPRPILLRQFLYLLFHAFFDFVHGIINAFRDVEINLTIIPEPRGRPLSILNLTQEILYSFDACSHEFCIIRFSIFPLVSIMEYVKCVFFTHTRRDLISFNFLEEIKTRLVMTACQSSLSDKDLLNLSTKATFIYITLA